MLWLKGWFETRWRIVITMVLAGLFFWTLTTNFSSLADRPFDEAQKWQIGLGSMAVFWLVVPIMLAGSGIQTVSGRPMRSSKGLEGSTLFTLSLPVTRARLFIVRTAIGLLETAVVLAAFYVGASIVFASYGLSWTLPDVLEHFLAAIACSFAVYGLSTCLSAFLDDSWHARISTLTVVVLWLLALRNQLPAAINVFRPMVQASPLVTHEFPLATAGTALLLSAAFLTVALKIVQSREF